MSPEPAVNGAGAAAIGAGAASSAAAASAPERTVDLTRVRPYADHLGDGLVQMSFTLPVPYGLAARKAAQEWAAKMGFEHPEVVHYQELTPGYTYFVMFAEGKQTVDYCSLSHEGFDIEYMSEEEIEFKRGGIIQTRAQEVLADAHALLERIADVGLFAALGDGVFGDVPRQADEGRGIEGIVEVDERYMNPASELMRGASSVA